MNEDDFRAQAIYSWLQNELHLQINNFTIASSDASFRRYFRVQHALGQQIVMDAPPDKEDINKFIKVAGLFADSGINVPDIAQKNLDQGYLLLQDFGQQCFLDVIDTDNADRLYQDAMDSLFRLQCNTDVNLCGLPRYDERLLHRELNIFSDWFIANLCQHTLTSQDQKMLQTTWSILIESALEQAVVCVHRDYHSRNLMRLTTNNPGIIDFQDAVIGPVTYDLVSLLRDCYITWPETRVINWLRNYYQRLKTSEIISCPFSKFQRWFDLMGLQRHLKAVGIFSRLQLRDNKPDYLNDIPRTMNYISSICAKYPELSPFEQFLKTQIMPLEQYLP